MASRYDWRRYGSVPEAIVTVIGDHYGLYGRVLPLDTDLSQDLGTDELDRLEVLITIEELFDIRLDRSAQASIRTIRDLVAMVELALAPSHS
jgi:acyl carrier protein